MDDLTQRLRVRGVQDNEMPNHYVRRMEIDRMEAAARIEALEAEVARLRAAMQPSPLDYMGLTLRTRKALRGAGVKTIADLRQMDDASLLRIPNLGRKGLGDIRAYIPTPPHVQHTAGVDATAPTSGC